MAISGMTPVQRAFWASLLVAFILSILDYVGPVLVELVKILSFVVIQ
jgi:hypothetical protein